MKLIIEEFEFELREMNSCSDRYVMYATTTEEISAYSNIAFFIKEEKGMKRYEGKGIWILGKYYFPHLNLKLN